MMLAEPVRRAYSGPLLLRNARWHRLV